MASIYMTKTSYDRLKAEVDELQVALRTTVAKEIGKAREHGDLRENAEYDAAKQKQLTYAKRVEEHARMLSSASLIEDLQISGKSVSVGTRVEMLDLDTAIRVTYNILGEGDGDIEKNIISYKTPIAQQIMTKERGDVAAVKLPAGDSRYIIMNVERIFN